MGDEDMQGCAWDADLMFADMGGLLVSLCVQVWAQKRKVLISSYIRLSSLTLCCNCHVHPPLSQILPLSPPPPLSSPPRPREGLSYTFMAVCKWHLSGAPDVVRAQVIAQTTVVISGCPCCHGFLCSDARFSLSMNNNADRL